MPASTLNPSLNVQQQTGRKNNIRTDYKMLPHIHYPSFTASKLKVLEALFNYKIREGRGEETLSLFIDICEYVKIKIGISIILKYPK